MSIEKVFKTKLSFLEKVGGIFNPVVTEDLREDAIAAIGKEFIFQADWVIEEGMYEGQYAMMPEKKEGEEGRLFGWVPEQDVVILKSLEEK